MIRSILCALLLAGVCAAQNPAGEPPQKQLPSPTGKFGVSRIGYDWTDAKRVDPTGKIAGDHREIMVYVWYPADKNRKDGRVDYLPGVDAIASSPEVKAEKEFWGDAWPLVSLDTVKIDASEGAPVAKGKDRFPLIVFSPEVGVNASSYTTLIEEVVSRGYIVAAIEPTFEVPAMAFPDGRVLGLSEDATGRRKLIRQGDTKEKFLQRLHDFDAGHLDKWAADIRLTIDKVSEIDSADKNTEPFSGRVDINNIAAWGHSFGGQAAARACQTEPRIKACLNADGVGTDGPIFAYPNMALPSRPFLWMEVHHDPPTEDFLASFHTTREAWDKDHQAQLAANEKELKACTGGSFHVTINLPGVEHLSFTDKPLIAAKNSEDADKATRALAAIEQYTLAFFDRYLKQQNGGVLDSGAAPAPGVTVETFTADAK
ncbi:MAG TPA: hypothetical protein VH088_24940 [Terriglobales bacterium]|jgi:dienelactone hydrolase|nr:hypothetical protein [Terriglobales bacterium]